MSFFRKRRLHRLRHLQLPAPKLIRRMRLRQNASGPKKLVQGQRPNVASR
jgi:hypothetical protein